MEKNQRVECQAAILPITDALYVLQGKWKLAIIHALSFESNSFRELERRVVGITPKMLSKELKELEQNLLISRKVLANEQGRVAYNLTVHGQTLKPVIIALRDWGLYHREIILGKNSK